jgi:hypothetical protein
MRTNGSIVGEPEPYDGIVCPVCFAELAEQKSVARFWNLTADEVFVTLETTTPSGRTWDPVLNLWVDP